MFRNTINIKLIATLTFIAIWVLGCDQPLFRNDLEAIQARGELVMITRNSTACYYEGPHGPAGFEYDLAKAFADYLGIRLRPLVIEEEADMVAALREGKADIIAAGFPFGSQAARMMALGPSYLKVRHQVIGRRGSPTFASIEDLNGTPIWMTTSSARMELLRDLKQKQSNLIWQSVSEHNSEELLQMVWNRSLPLALVGSTTLKINRRFYPELVAHFDIGQPQHLSWAMHRHSRYLQRAVRSWFRQADTRELVEGLSSHYYSHLEDFDYVDLARYRRRIGDRLPKYQEHFVAAAEKYELDWRLVAAQAYQESHWNPRAKSFTGVRGIMMLTQETAKTLGLKNRLQVKETIFAGTRYLARLHRMVGDEVSEPDRTLMALAAYNIGFGHLQDARHLAQTMGKSDNSWYSLRAVLPLLQKKQYYRKLSHGYARGNEAVQYVDRIRTYYKVLIMATAPEEFDLVGG